MTAFRVRFCFAAAASAAAALPSALLAENVEATSLSRITRDVNYLASDELEGRGVETAGNVKAAEYIRDQFEAAGLKPGMPDGTYFQPFTIKLGSQIEQNKTHLTLTGPDGKPRVLDPGVEYEVLSLGPGGTVDAEIVFAGYGITDPDDHYEDFANADVKGKVVVVLRREPQQSDPNSVFAGTDTTSYSFIRTKAKAALDAGAAAVLLVNDAKTVADEKQDAVGKPSAFGTSGSKLPFAQVTRELVNELLTVSPLKATDDTGNVVTLSDLDAVETQIDATLKPVTQPIAGWKADLVFTLTERTKEVNNVVAVLPGQGPTADEYVVVGAHLDHVGYGEVGSRKPGSNEIHNGADDNASGSAALVETARRLAALGPQPRTVIFVAFNGEERGLLGSAYYVEHPTVPLEKMSSMLNYDMVGRLGDSPLTIYGTGSAKSFDAVVNDAHKQHESVDVKLVPGVRGDSDHYSFYNKKVPCFHLFTGLTKEYHTPEDDVATLNLPGIEQSVDLAMDMLHTLLTQPKPEYVAVPTERREGRGDMAYFGVVPDYSGIGDGLKINGTTPDSPAAKAGFEENDVIIKFGELPVADIEGLSNALRKYKAGEKVNVVVRRGAEEKTLEVELAASRRSAR